ncbi:MAG: hypothetical protein ABIO44_10080, partial [Saprospiraceae bacterium]
LCPSGGVPNNTSWWAFVTQGGNVCLNFKISNCSINGDGIQVGLYGDCNCNESIICNSTCNNIGINQLCGILSPCKTYYLDVDGCSGDVCDFEISIPIGGSGSPGHLPTFKNIEGPLDVCNLSELYSYKAITSFPSCVSNFSWFLNGEELEQYSNEVKIKFPKVGTYVLCGYSVLGNPISGSVCDFKGPVCKTIRAYLYNGKNRFGSPCKAMKTEVDKMHIDSIAGSYKY